MIILIIDHISYISRISCQYLVPSFHIASGSQSSRGSGYGQSLSAYNVTYKSAGQSIIEEIKRDRERPPHVQGSMKGTKGRRGAQQGYEERKEEEIGSSSSGAGGKKRAPLRLSK